MRARLLNKVEKEVSNYVNPNKHHTSKNVHITPEYTEATNGNVHVRVTPTVCFSPEEYPTLLGQGCDEFEEVMLNGEDLKKFKPMKQEMGSHQILDHILITKYRDESIVQSYNLKTITGYSESLPNEPYPDLGIDYHDGVLAEVSINPHFLLDVLKIYAQNKTPKIKIKIAENRIILESPPSDETANRIQAIVMRLRE